jgi:hypothetical protein
MYTSVAKAICGPTTPTPFFQDRRSRTARNPPSRKTRGLKDPQPYKDPVEPTPGDPKEDRPMRDPVQPGTDVPRS